MLKVNDFELLRTNGGAAAFSSEPNVPCSEQGKSSTRFCDPF